MDNIDYSQNIIAAGFCIIFVAWLIRHLSTQAQRPKLPLFPREESSGEQCVDSVLRFLKGKPSKCEEKTCVQSVVTRNGVNVDVKFCPQHFSEATTLDATSALERGWDTTWLFPKTGPATLQFPHKFLKLDRQVEHTIELLDPWFDLVKSGRKTWEGRRYWKKTKKFKIGDILKVTHRNDKQRDPYYLRIEGIVRFNTFEEALSAMKLEEVLPGVDTIKQGVEIYYQFVSLPTQLADGVCMIKVSLV